MRIITFFIFIFFLVGCGTDYYYSSFVVRKDFQWLSSPLEQETLDDRAQIGGSTSIPNRSNAPSIIATPANYLVAIYESRDTGNHDVISIDGDQNKRVNVSVAISKNSLEFLGANVIGIKSSGGVSSHGAPISFLTKEGNIVVLATSGVGFGGSSQYESYITVSTSTNNGIAWSDWENLDNKTVFKPLLDQGKGIDRFYTTPGNGTTLRNGTLVCMIDYRSSNTGNKYTPIGTAVLYSTDSGKTWQLGATMQYSSQHRFAKIIAERKDGSLLIAASPNTGDGVNAYTQQGKLSWYTLSDLNATITPYSVTSPMVNTQDGTGYIFDQVSGGVVSGDKIKYTYNGIAQDGIVLLHSYPKREQPIEGGYPKTVINGSAISISGDDGKTWTMITNVIGKYAETKTSFRHSVRVLKDGSIAIVLDEGVGPKYLDKEPTIAVYKRVGLSYISDGKYKYDGL